MGRRHILAEVEAQRCLQPWVGRVQDTVVFLLGASRIVPQPLHVIGGLGPGTLQFHAAKIEYHAGVAHQVQAVALVQAADDVQFAAQPR